MSDHLQMDDRRPALRLGFHPLGRAFALERQGRAFIEAWGNALDPVANELGATIRGGRRGDFY